MPVTLHAPPPLTHQDGLPPFSAQRATLRHTPPHATAESPLRGQQLTASPPPSSPPRPASAPHAHSSTQEAEREFIDAQRLHMSASPMFITTAALREGRPLVPRAAVVTSSAAPITHPPSTATASASSSSSSVTTAVEAAAHPLFSDDRAGRAAHLVSHSGGGDRHDAALPYPFSSYRPPPDGTGNASAATVAPAGVAVVTVPLATLVEQQKTRIHDLLRERDSLAESLQELRDLFQRLSDDYEQAAQESEARQLTVDRLQTEHTLAQEELTQARFAGEQLRQRINGFEEEWEARTKHLRDRLDALLQERDAAQDQRDGCMSELTDLRQQLQQLQKTLFDAEGRHREALRAQTETHAQELRLALQEKAEQLHTRAAATRLEAQLTQQQMSQLGAKHSAAEEDRAALQWRIAELETVVDRREHLRAELERMVTSLRAQVSEQEQQRRGEAQRYAQRVREMEQTHEAQVQHEQHRCLTLKDELAAARRALQEAHRQHEAQAEDYAARTREATSRATRQEEELREQLRQARAALTAATSLAAQHETAAVRCQREAEALRSTAASQQEQHAQLQEAQTAQTQQLRRVEGRAAILQTRLQEKEKEAEVLRCAMEQTSWTQEARAAMQHTLAALLGVPRAAAAKWLLQGSTTEAPQLEWPPATTPASPQAGGAGAAAAAQSPSAAAVASSPVTDQPGAAEKEEFSTPNEAAANETGDVRSPVRDAAASTRTAAVHHVESIERTALRDHRRSSGSIFTVGQSPHTFTAPPLHPGSPLAPAAVASSAVTRVPQWTPGFTSAHTSSLLSSQHTPSQLRHQYNVVAGEETERGDAAQRVEASPPAVDGDEVFFDDLHTPSAHRGGLRRPASATPYTTTQDRHVQQPAAAHTPGQSPIDSLRGAAVQAAELLAQLPLRAPATGAAAAAATATSSAPPSFASAAQAARRLHRPDHLGDDADGLQRYLKETVHHVLSTQQHQQRQQQQAVREVGHGRQAPPPHDHHVSASAPRPSTAVQPKNLPGHSHYTQLYDGSPVHSGSARRAGEEEEEDFGSVSRPRSVLSMLPWQHRTPRSTSAATGPAAAEGSAPRVALLRTPTHSASSSAQSRNRPSAPTSGKTQRRIDVGVADTLEQLARRQQRLLQSLERENGVLLAAAGGDRSAAAPQSLSAPVDPNTWPSSFLPAADAAAASLRGGVLSSAPAEVSATTGSDAGLDPRQLSYATAATTSVTASSAWGEGERRWRQQDAAPAPRSHTHAEPVRRGKTPAAAVAGNAAATPPAAPALFPPSSPHADAVIRAAGGETPQHGQERAPSLPSADACAGAPRAAAPPVQERVREDEAEEGRFTAATTTSALTSVSDVSSLAQLERRFAQPFHR